MRTPPLKGLLAVILFAVLTLGSGNVCHAQSETLTDVIKSLQENLPISMGWMGEITGISINDGNLLLTCSVDESVIDISKLQKEPDLMKTNMLQWLSGSNYQYGFFFDALTEEDLGLKVLYIGKTSGDSVSCELTTAEIKKRDSFAKNYDPMKHLDLQLQQVNAQMPMKEDEGLTCTKVARKGKYVVYYFLCDEPEYDMKLMKKIQPTMYALALNGLNSDDVSITQFRRLCIEAKVGIAYYYIGKKSGKTAKVKIPHKDLRY